MRQKLTLTKNTKNRAFSAENGVKMPQNQTFPFVTKSLKSATSQNFPNFFTEIIDKIITGLLTKIAFSNKQIN